jgi:hypothetical protein
LLNFFYNENKKIFECRISECDDNTQLLIDHINILKRAYFVWDKFNKVWYCKRKDFPEKKEFIRLTGFSDCNFFISCEEELKKITKEYEHELEFYRENKFDDKILKPHIKLFPYQKKDIEIFIKRNAHLNLNDAGLGKTIEEIYWFSYLYKHGLADGIILLVRSHLVSHWMLEILETSTVFKEDDIKIIYNEDKITPYEKYKDKKILIIPHDYWKDTILSYRKDYKKKRSWKNIRWKNEIKIKEKWGKENICVCVDESHWFKNPSSIKIKALSYEKDQFKYRSMATASMSPNRLEEYYTQCKFISDGFIKKTQKEFEYWLCRGYNFKIRLPYYDIEKSQSFLHSLPYISVRTLQADVPEMKVKRLLHENKLFKTDLQHLIYRKISSVVLEKIHNEFDEIIYKEFDNRSQILYEVLDNLELLKNRNYEILQNRPEILELINKWSVDQDPKLKWLKDMVKDHVVKGGEKLIIYCSHPETNNLIKETFKGIKSVSYHGKLNVKDTTRYKNEIIKQFNEDPETKLAIYSSLSLSDGANHHKVCNRILIYEIPFDSIRYIQLRDRTHRIVSTKDTHISYPNYARSLDNRRVKRMLNRSELNDLLHKKIPIEKLKLLLAGEIF